MAKKVYRNLAMLGWVFSLIINFVPFITMGESEQMGSLTSALFFALFIKLIFEYRREEKAIIILLSITIIAAVSGLWICLFINSEVPLGLFYFLGPLMLIPFYGILVPLTEMLGVTIGIESIMILATLLATIISVFPAYFLWSMSKRSKN